MDLNSFHSKLTKGSEYPYLLKFIILTISSWLFQGVLYMDKTEQYFKIMVDFLLFTLITLILAFSFGLRLETIILAILIAHSLNWIFNGQIFVLLKNLKLTKTDHETFDVYLKDLTTRIKNENSIIASAYFGSLARENISETSDLDVRIIRREGFINGIKSCFFILKERTRSFILQFPLDIYVLDSSKPLKKLDEQPIIMTDNKKIIEQFKRSNYNNW